MDGSGRAVKVIGGIKWETDPDGGWLTREPARFLECRLAGWVCERPVLLGDTRGYLRGWGATSRLAVKALLRIEQRLIEELSK